MASPVPPGLIVNADDLGIHPRINAGIVSAYRHGILTSCTMLMTTAYFDQTIRDYVRPQALPIGIHLSLTLGKAVAPRGEVADLVDEDGNLKLTADRLILSSFKGERGGALLRQIGREFEAQLAMARDHGLKPTHADSHQHVHMNPAIFRLLEALLPRFGIDRLRFSREAFHAFVLGPDLAEVMRRNNLAKWALLRWRAAALTPALATTDDFFGVLYSGAVTKRAMLSLLRAASPGVRWRFAFIRALPRRRACATIRGRAITPSSAPKRASPNTTCWPIRTLPASCASGVSPCAHSTGR